MKDRGIYVVEYVKGITEAYIYMGTMPGYRHLPDVDLFNGFTTGNTIARQTLEKLLKDDNN